MEEGHAGGRQSGVTVAEGVPAPRSKEAPELEAEAVKYDQTAVLELAREELQRDKVAQELARVTELLQLEDERLTHQTAIETLEQQTQQRAAGIVQAEAEEQTLPEMRSGLAEQEAVAREAEEMAKQSRELKMVAAEQQHSQLQAEIAEHMIAREMLLKDKAELHAFQERIATESGAQELARCRLEAESELVRSRTAELVLSELAVLDMELKQAEVDEAHLQEFEKAVARLNREKEVLRKEQERLRTAAEEDRAYAAAEKHALYKRRKRRGGFLWSSREGGSSTV